jgi:hypothetical protein
MGDGGLTRERHVGVEHAVVKDDVGSVPRRVETSKPGIPTLTLGSAGAAVRASAEDATGVAPTYDGLACG